MFEHEREALRAAEAARERLSLFSEVTRLLSSSLEPTTVIRRTMSLVEGRLADSCIVQVPSDSGLVRLDMNEPSPHRRDVRAAQRQPPRDPSLRVRGAGRSGLPYGSDTAGAPPRRRRRAGEPSASTALAVPLTANGEVIGVMTFIDGPAGSSKRTTSRWRPRWASRAGVALSTSWFKRGHVVADVLHGRCCPDSLPEVEGLVLDAEYRAGVAGSYAGGDWYDVFELGDDSVFFSVGDVMGKGAPAAALMGQVRSAIRAYVVSGDCHRPKSSRHSTASSTPWSRTGSSPRWSARSRPRPAGWS